VIWATGYALDHTWIDAPVFDDRGAVVQDRGVTPVPGLYFLGLPWMHTRGSALLGWVGDDAAHVAGVIARRAAARA
jgi:putative flavoprotein involved in K+ transport